MEPKMDRKRTLTMNWAGLGADDDDDRFFESLDRVSSAVPLDLASSGSDDDFDDSRMSFASTVSSASEFRNLGVAMTPDYDIWMAAPGSITERRKRLLQGMGLSNSKNDNKIVSTNSSSDNISNTCNEEPKEQDHSYSQSPLPILLVKSRSDGDIESLCIEKRRKQDLVGLVSKQRLTRTFSLISHTSCGRICPYQDSVRVLPSPNVTRGNNGRQHNNGGLTSLLSSSRFGAFFLIKNLDTGKEFIVNGYDEDGMWNRLSDLQTGKQLTMEEFEKCVGYSPVVKELMRRENVSRLSEGPDKKYFIGNNSYLSKSLRTSKRRGAALLKNIKGVANSMSLRGEKDLQREGAAVANAQEQKQNKNSGNEWIKVRQTGKSYKELSALHLCQEIQAHQGSIWTIKFSSDGRFLASAGEDKVIHVWEVQECEILSMNEGNLTPIHPSMSSSPDRPPVLGDISPMPSEKKKKGKGSSSRRANSIPDYVHVPETVCLLSEKPVCSFTGHLDDVLDLSWSRSQLLLSSSMDKTVRLWDMETKSCLKLFAHNDYVTCIHFNPMDDDYFISGSLDAKIRIWSIPERQVVNWADLHEMVTAACYTPDGQGAVIGSHKGGCRMYCTEDCKLNQKHQIDLRNKKKSSTKKITGFQFSPGNPTEVLVTSADSRIRIVDGTEVTHKFRGFRNTSSQISASFSVDGKYIISASEDSQVYVWKREENRDSAGGKSRSIITTRSHEHFQCRDVSVAIPWPGTVKGDPPPAQVHCKRNSKRSSQPPSGGDSPTKADSCAANSKRQLPPRPKKNNNVDTNLTPPEEELAQASCTESEVGESFTNNSSSIQFGDSPSMSAEAAAAAPSFSHCSSIGHSDTPSVSAAALTPSLSHSSSILRQGDSPSISAAAATPSTAHSSSIRHGDSHSISAAANSSSSSWSSSWSWFDSGNHASHSVQATAWGLVIVTATLGGEIRIYQNFGLPRKIGRQTALF
ncbi:WD40 domain-containing protein [Cephalotus follicularis]|uniref:WD40 domain-containing protein n=1 Tax=Cephalotus follicularis TaxID=3775 RepID=A0A1Q3CUH6_CEPFO|nr:WD40 domain-containing protein [Cephalotus follicularis]